MHCATLWRNWRYNVKEYPIKKEGADMAKIASYTPVIPTAEPFLFLGDEIGILLVHGFTGTPKEMRTMGEFFADQGKTVLGIRLPGHATQPEDMRGKRWQDWVQAGEDGYDLLRCDRGPVVLMGDC